MVKVLTLTKICLLNCYRVIFKWVRVVSFSLFSKGQGPVPLLDPWWEYGQNVMTYINVTFF